MQTPQLLKNFDLANEKLQQEFTKYGHIVDFSKENNPIDSESTLHFFYVILSGKLKVYDINFETGREQVLYLLTTGDMFDVVPLLDNKPHELAVDVLEKGKAVQFPLEKVREWINRFPTFENLIYKYMANQIRSVENLAIDLSLYDTKTRLLKLLLKNLESLEAKGVSLIDKLSHAEIANLIGTVRHIVDRHLKELENEGAIAKEKRKVVIKNAKKLLEKLHNF